MPESRKRVLLFSAKLGYQTRSFEAAAKKLNVELAYVTDRCHQLNDPWEDQAIAAHFDKPAEAAQAVIDHWRGKNVDGILALGDRPAHAAALAARALSIPFHHPAAVEACRSKKRTREVLRDAGLPGPWFRAVALEPPPEPALLGISYPCVLKPLALSASQGVVRANTREEFIAAAARIRKLLRTPEIQATREANLDEMIVEGYLPGREVALEALMTAGELRVLAIFDKPDPLEGPYFEETIYVTPSRLPVEQIAAIEKMLRACVTALGLSHGPVHAEFRVDQATGDIWPLEIAPRPIGGLCAQSLRFVSPDAERSAETFGLEELLLRHALELSGSNALRESAASGVMMIPVPASGIFQGVSGEPEAAATPHVSKIAITGRVHDYIAAWPEGSSYLGFIFATGETPELVEAALRGAHAKLKFEITPRLEVHHPSARV
ncbi:MAG TPA: ATP-grasp domain-containing protein [Candidatus Dormibacteraeota bacterium]|nr:ATP-grasp domain-containing protein [Candidatus Dormibacteraeota bacterium]